LAIGISSHAVGVAKALEMGPVEGAVSSLAIGVGWFNDGYFILNFRYFL